MSNEVKAQRVEEFMRTHTPEQALEDYRELIQPLAALADSMASLIQYLATLADSMASLIKDEPVLSSILSLRVNMVVLDKLSGKLSAFQIGSDREECRS